jgi:hypothetical protein
MSGETIQKTHPTHSPDLNLKIEITATTDVEITTVTVHEMIA